MGKYFKLIIIFSAILVIITSCGKNEDKVDEHTPIQTTNSNDDKKSNEIEKNTSTIEFTDLLAEDFSDIPNITNVFTDSGLQPLFKINFNKNKVVSISYNSDFGYDETVLRFTKILEEDGYIELSEHKNNEFNFENKKFCKTFVKESSLGVRFIQINDLSNGEILVQFNRLFAEPKDDYDIKTIELIDFLRVDLSDIPYLNNVFVDDETQPLSNVLFSGSVTSLTYTSNYSYDKIISDFTKTMENAGYNEIKDKENVENYAGSSSFENSLNSVTFVNKTTNRIIQINDLGDGNILVQFV